MSQQISFKSVKRVQPRQWVLGLLALLVVMRLAWGWSHNTDQAKRVARELGAMSVIQKPPVSNADGSKLGVIHSTERGVGMFIVDTATKSEEKIFETSDAVYDIGTTHALGWSPDGRCFAFGMTNTLFFYEGAGADSLRQFAMEKGLLSFGWLSGESCVYLNGNSVLRSLKRHNGEWLEVNRWNLSRTNGRPRSLLVLDSTRIAWQSDNGIWEMRLSDGEIIQRVFDSKAAVTGLDYSTNAGALLVTQTRTSTNRITVATLSKLPVGGRLEELLSRPVIQNAKWVNGGTGYAYMTTRVGRSLLMLRPSMLMNERPVLDRGQVLNITCDRKGSAVFAQAALTNEPPGVWRCDAEYGNTIPVWTPSATELKTGFQPVLKGWATYGNKHAASFDLVPPAGFSRSKKYPLIIGTASYDWTPIAHGTYAQALARGGAYVALVDYRWNQSDPDTIMDHTNNILAVYDKLLANPNIDPEKVYLFGFSAGTMVVKSLAEMYPGRWKGVMLFNPSALPEARDGIASRVLATAGEAEEGAERRLQAYQMDLCKAGVPATVFIHKDGRHILRAKDSMRDRALLMVDFVFE